MSLTYKGTNIDIVKYNGTNLEKINYNDTTIWEEPINATVYGGKLEPMIITSSNGMIYNITTDSAGLATIKLKKDTYSCKGTISNETFSSTLTKENPYIYGRPKNIIYWYGISKGLQDCTSANGWSYADITTNSTWNTNSIKCTSKQNNYINAVGASGPLNGTVYFKTGDCSQYMYVFVSNEKCILDSKRYSYRTTPSNSTFSVSSPNKYVAFYAVNGNYGTLYGVWM